jgi:iron complex transport system substrate-binding protein
MRRTANPLTICLAFALAAALAVAGCGSTNEAPPPAAPADSAAYPVTVGDLTLTKKPERIVSLSSTATEMLFAIDAGSQVVAVDDNSNFPAEAPKTAMSAYQPNAEAIAGHQPDLVVLSNDTDGIVAQLAALSIPTFLAPAATTLDDSYKQIRDLGALTGHRAEADALAERMRDDIAKLVADLPARTTPLTYYYELDPTFYSVTSNTFIGSLFTNAGLQNIADGTAGGIDYPQLSAEVIVQASPDLIFLADTKCCGQSAATVAARSGWGNITAVTSGGVVALDDDIASRWGPRVVDLQRTIVEAVAKAPVG